MNPVRALRHTSSSPAAPTSNSGTTLDPQIRAAGIMGRIIDFFDAVAACPDEALERVRGRLVDELASGRVDGSLAPHDSRRRNAVLTAALTCVQASAERSRRPESRPATVGTPGLWGVGQDRPTTAGEVMHRIHRVLDGVTALQDPAGSDSRPRGVDVLAHMLRGPEPSTWTRDQQDFGRCALEWMKARVGDTAPEADRRPRWSTSARRREGLPAGPGGSMGVVLTA